MRFESARCVRHVLRGAVLSDAKWDNRLIRLSKRFVAGRAGKRRLAAAAQA
jgi:hypothetical protein